MASKETLFSPIVLMIDNETLALGPNAYLTQVGFVLGNVLTRERIIKDSYSLLGAEQPGRKIDPDTIRWWMFQPEPVRRAVFDDEPAIKPQWLFDMFKNIVDTYPGVTVWAGPSAFDLAQLTTLFDGKPWSYKQERCLMTVYKLLDPDAEYQPPNNEMAHDAQSDADWQFEYLCNLVALLPRGSWLSKL